MARGFGQYCGVATALELVGERWALLIVRDLLVGPRRYTDLKQGLPRIPTNILSTRLKDLQEAGVVRRVHLAHCGLVYELTEYGRDLEDVVLALGRWGFKAMGVPDAGDVMTADSLTVALRTAFRADVAGALAPTVYDLHAGPVGLRASASGSSLRVDRIPPTQPPGAARDQAPDLAFATGPGLRELIAGELSTEQALDAGSVTILAGDPGLLDRFVATFHLDADPRPLPTFP